MSECPDCGTAVDAGDDFCRSCGVPLGDDPGPDGDPDPADGDGHPDDRPGPAGGDAHVPGPSGGDPLSDLDPVTPDSDAGGRPAAVEGEDGAGVTAGRGLALVGAAVAVVGALLPWYRIVGLGATVARRGVDGDGRVTLALAALAALLVAVRWGGVSKATVASLGVAVAAVGVLHVLDPLVGVDSATERAILRGTVRGGPGAPVTAAGGAAMVLGPALDAVRRRIRGPTGPADR